MLLKGNLVNSTDGIFRNLVLTITLMFNVNINDINDIMIDIIYVINNNMINNT